MDPQILPKSIQNRSKKVPKTPQDPSWTPLGTDLGFGTVFSSIFHRFQAPFGSRFGGNLGAMRHLIFSDFLETFPEASQEPLERFWEPFGPHFGSILGSFFDAPCHLVEARFCCYLLHLRHFEPPQERLKSHFFQDPF